MPYSWFKSDKMSSSTDCFVCVRGPQSAVYSQVVHRLEKPKGRRKLRFDGWSWRSQREGMDHVLGVNYLAGEENITGLGLYLLHLLGWVWVPRSSFLFLCPFKTPPPDMSKWRGRFKKLRRYYLQTILFHVHNF